MSVFRHVFLRWCDVCYLFPRCCGVDSPPMSPSLSYLEPVRNSKTFLHVIYKSKKKTNLLCILNNVFQYSKIRTRKRNAKKSIKTGKNLESSPFWNPESTELESGIQYSESGIHRVESRIQDCHGFPYMGRDFPYICLQFFQGNFSRQEETFLQTNVMLQTNVLNILKRGSSAWSCKQHSQFFFQ